MTTPRAVHVHVHLDAGRSPESWRQLVQRRAVWETDPYGYGLLADRCRLTYSVDAREPRPLALLRRSWRRILGLDLVHAWRNRAALRDADYVVTHTENEFLAVLLLLRLVGDTRAKTICQAVWLWDRWGRLSRARRRAYRALMIRAAVLTVLSPANLVEARHAIPDRPAVLIPFGVRPLPEPCVETREVGSLRVLAVGNDRDRDWRVLAAAVRRLTDAEVRVRSRTRSARRAFASQEASVRPSTSIDEYFADLAWCDVVVVPVRRNRHASGVTAALEAVSAGRPLVVADAGGLRDYFGEEVHYYEVGAASSLVLAIRAAAATGCLAAPGGSPGSFVVERGLTSVDYALRHLSLIESLQAGEPIEPEVSSFQAVERRGVGP